MSIWSDTAIKELQEKVAWLEKEIAQLKAADKTGSTREPSPLSRGNGPRKPS